MGIGNWKLWLFPFAAWGLALVWYSGYQSGYREGHETAAEMAHRKITWTDVDLTRNATRHIPAANSFNN